MSPISTGGGGYNGVEVERMTMIMEVGMMMKMIARMMVVIQLVVLGLLVSSDFFKKFPQSSWFSESG